MNCNHQLFLTFYQSSVQHIAEFDEIPASRRGLGNKNKKIISSIQYKFHDCLPPEVMVETWNVLGIFFQNSNPSALALG